MGPKPRGMVEKGRRDPEQKHKHNGAGSVVGRWKQSVDDDGGDEKVGGG